MKTFETWTFHLVKFIAIDNGQSSHVIDEHGNNYGSWQNLDKFRKRQREGDPLALTVLGKARLEVRIT